MASNFKIIFSLSPTNQTDEFDCGIESLNKWLDEHALRAIRSKSANTYVVVIDNQVVAYYSLAAGEVARTNSPERLAKGLGKHPIPVIVLARLAVDKRIQGAGLGALLLQDAIKRAILTSEIVGARALITHPINEQASEFYKAFGFTEVLGEYQYLLIKDAKKFVK
jgi:GNAT superfamily N-acetyltransferase